MLKEFIDECKIKKGEQIGVTVKFKTTTVAGVTKTQKIETPKYEAVCKNPDHMGLNMRCQ